MKFTKVIKAEETNSSHIDNLFERDLELIEIIKSKLKQMPKEEISKKFLQINEGLQLISSGVSKLYLTIVG